MSKLSSEKRLTDLTVISGARLDRERLEDRTGILDVRAKTAQGIIINIEVQLANQYDMEKRTLFYWSRLYAGQLEKGQNYSALKKTITINILDFRYLANKKYHNVFHLREDEDSQMLTDIMEVHFIEMPKFIEEKLNIEDSLHRWLIFLSDPQEEVISMLEIKDEQINKANKVLHYLSSDPETVRLAELRDKAIWDEVSRIEGAREEGIQQGIQQRDFAIARRMLAKGNSPEDVAEMIGLSLEEVYKLQH